MRVVLDTNVFISGIFWIGTPNKIITYWKEGRFTLISSLGTVVELARILKDFKIKLPEDVIKEWVDIIIKNSVMVEPKEKLNIIKDDPKDNIFIETAVAGNANYIISQDKHILKIKEYKRIKILTPEEFEKIN